MSSPIVLLPGQPVPARAHGVRLPDGSFLITPPPLEDGETDLYTETVTASAFGYDPNEARDDHGRWTDDGGGDSAQVAGTTITLTGRPDGTGTPDDPIYVGKDLERAQQLLAEGKSIRMDDKKVASLLVARLGEYAQQLKARGEKSPNYDLCDVTVENTNLFCEGNKGFRRAEMPQLGGPAIEGSPAAGKRTDPNNPNETVNVEAEFHTALLNSGVDVVDKTVSASRLRATQSEINGAKTGAILQGMLAGKELLGGKQIWTSKDGYVLDGHHRWAAGIAQSLLVGGDGGQVAVHEVQMEIGAALDFARAFTKDIGIRQLDVSAFALVRLAALLSARDVVDAAQVATDIAVWVTDRPPTFPVAGGAAATFDWDPDKHPRDEHGRFIGDGGKAEPDVTRYASFDEVKPAPGFSQRLGNCYQEAAQHVLATPGATLVHGSIQGLHHVPINHAWAVNPDGTVFDAVLGVRFHPDDFQKLFNPVAFEHYDGTEMRVQLVTHQHWGPWDDRSTAIYEAAAA